MSRQFKIAWLLLSVLSLVPAHGESLTNGLMACFQFNGNANDTSGNGYHGSNSNVSFTSDRFGRSNQAASFNGTGASCIKIYTTNLNITANFSVSAWIRFTAGLGTQNPRIFSTSGYEIGTQTTAGDRFAYFNNTTASAGAPTIYSPNTIHAGSWWHIVGVRSGNELRLYVNGGLVGLVVATQPPDYSTGFIPEIGGNSGSYSDAFGGLIDDVRIYNRALSTEEVGQLNAHESTMLLPIAHVGKVLHLDFTNLVAGGFYQLQTSLDLTNWNNYSLPFIASSNTYSPYVDVGWGNNFFRLSRP